MDLELFSVEGKNDYWGVLKNCLSGNVDVKKVKKAYDFALKAHWGQKRKSGLEYISHPVWVAKVVALLEVGTEAILAAVLHDCVEDTSIASEKVAEIFGDEVALLVEGLTEVKKKTKGIKVHEKNIEVFKRFLFSSVDDVRILIIRLADKLHNGLTLKYLIKSDQVKYAKRVMGIYAPVAEYVGMHYFKKRLEDIAFRVLYPMEAKKLERVLESSRKNELKALAEVRGIVDQLAKINRIDGVEVQGRIKSLYSTFCKIKKKGQGGVKDRAGIRILTNSVVDCYTMLGLLHSKYQYLDDEFDDYISTPKPNGYRSLQTALRWKKKLTVEIQIRTFEMHDFNEFGPASHIAYKYGTKKKGAGFDWVRDLVKWQETRDGVNNYRIKVLTNFIYVFTPKGDTIQLPADSTALDFAYRIHSDLGDCCKGAKINGKIAKINTRLETGDMVEILKGKKKNVGKNWLEFVKTTAAKERIRRAL